MPTVKAAGYAKTAISSQANQSVINRHVWDCTVQAAADKVLIGQLPAGHRALLKDLSAYFNANCPAMNIDLCIGLDTNVVLNDQAVAASTATLHKPTDNAALHTLEELIGVDFDNDRDIYLIINSGAATAPAGAKVIVTVQSFPVGTPD